MAGTRVGRAQTPAHHARRPRRGQRVPALRTKPGEARIRRARQCVSAKGRLSAGSSARSPRATSGREAGESGRAADGESRRQGGPVQKRRSQQQPGGQGIFDEQVGLLTEQTGLREYAADLAVFVVMEGLVMVVAVTREPFVMVRIGGRGPMVTMVERAGGGATVAGIRGDARERSVMMIEAAGPVQRSAKRRLEEEEKQQSKSGGAHR